MLKNILRFFILTLLVIISMFIVAGGLAKTIAYGIEKDEKVNCIKWSEQAKEIPSDIYFVKSWQVEQCNRHGIELDARVQE